MSRRADLCIWLTVSLAFGSSSGALAEPITLTIIPELEGLQRLELLSATQGGPDALLVSGTKNNTEHLRYWHVIPGQTPSELFQDTVTADPSGDGTLKVFGESKDGSVLLYAQPNGTALPNWLGIYLRDVDGLQEVWKRGQMVAGMDFKDPASWTINTSSVLSAAAVGLVVTYNPSSGTGANQAQLVWTKAGGLHLLGQPGDAAPGIDNQFFLKGNMLVPPHIEGIAQNTGEAYVSGRYVPTGNETHEAWWYGNDYSALQLAWRFDDVQTPFGVPGPITTVDLLHMFADGSAIIDPSFNRDISPEHRCCYFGPRAALKYVADAFALDGFPDGARIDSAPFSPNLFAEPHVAVVTGKVMVANRAFDGGAYGLWVFDGAAMHLVSWKTLNGDAGTEFGGPGTLLFFALNEHGQFVVALQRTSPLTLLRFTPGVGYEEIVKLGAVVKGHDGKEHAISTIEGTAGVDIPRKGVAIDSKGRVSFVAKFTDGTAALITSSGREAGPYEHLSPEPSSTNAASSQAGSAAGAGGRSTGAQQAGQGGAAMSRDAAADAGSGSGGTGGARPSVMRTAGGRAGSAPSNAGRGAQAEPISASNSEKSGGCTVAVLGYVGASSSSQPMALFGLAFIAFRWRRRR